MTDLTRALQALRDGDWDLAHDNVQNLTGPEADWIHAHLHRVEGDLANAAYWYRRAGKPMPQCSPEDERAQILTRLRP